MARRIERRMYFFIGKLEIERGKVKIETAKNNTFFMVIWGFVCRYVSILYFSLFGAVTAEGSKKDRRGMLLFYRD